MNRELIHLYKTEFKNLEPRLKSFEFDGPLLMKVWEDEYLKSKYKILFLGRESNGWHGDLITDVELSINRYIEFELCNNGNYTTFWQYIYEFKNILMPETIGQRNFLWSNVSKFSTLDGKAIELDDFEFFATYFNVLESEIKITKPDVIIFFTNNNWDKKIQYQISDKISYKQLNKEISVDELSRLTSANLPYHTYRVPHPITMQTQNKWKYMELIIDEIRNIDMVVKSDITE